MEDAVERLDPEPWPLHLLGLISPFLVIAGNVLGGAFTLSGVVFIWVVSPILDIIMGESKITRPPRDSGRPFITAVGARDSPLCDDGHFLRLCILRRIHSLAHRSLIILRPSSSSFSDSDCPRTGPSTPKTSWMAIGTIPSLQYQLPTFYN